VDAVDLIGPLMLAAVVAAGTTPVAIRIALALGVVDRPNDRKINARDGIPLLGGLAVVVGCLVGLVAFQWVIGDPDIWDRRILTFAAGGTVLFLLGAWDDRFYLNAWQKLPVQIGAAALAIWAGFSIDYFTSPLTLTTHALPEWLSWPITLFWIVGVTNAMNLIDGLDGLSAGTGAIISATMAVICWQADQTTGVVIGVAMLGALIGFLPWNFPPARIFLGDAGALFIGYALALVSIQGYRKAALLTFIVPLLALAVPLLDVTLSIVRRLRLGKGIFHADRMHMHHRLLEKEGSHKRAVLWLYFQTACFSVIAVSFAQLEGFSAYIFLAAVVVLTLRLLRNLGLFSIKLDDTAVDGAPKGAEGEKT
jgi:UDP-GlcNAc:undecaprenyl-phosphate GlcNAc-1-phosphate transferase